jgi:hypothetical protein
VVSFFESVFADHSKDHPVAVTYFSSDTHTSDPYTTLLDSTPPMNAVRERAVNRECTCGVPHHTRTFPCGYWARLSSGPVMPSIELVGIARLWTMPAFGSTQLPVPRIGTQDRPRAEKFHSLPRCVISAA